MSIAGKLNKYPNTHTHTHNKKKIETGKKERKDAKIYRVIYIAKRTCELTFPKTLYSFQRTLIFEKKCISNLSFGGANPNQFPSKIRFKILFRQNYLKDYFT